MDAEEKDYEPLKTSCDKLKDFIQDVQEKESIDDRNKKRLDQIQKNIVNDASTLINTHLKKKLTEIKQKVDPLIQETNELIESINSLSLEPGIDANKKLFSKRESKKQKLQG